jgi:NitT/TauT family transport system substrate-binding protein
MRRRAAVALVALASLGPLARRATAQPALEPIRMVGQVAEDITDLYYAIKNGAFRRAGLDVSIVPTGSGSAATTAVVAGTYELSRTSVPAVLYAHVRNLPVTIVAPSIVNSERDPYAMLQIAVDATYKTAADLNGKTIGTPALNDMNVLAIRAWVDKNGGDYRSLKYVEIPSLALASAVASHRVDAAMLTSPHLDASLAAKTTKTLAYAFGALAPVFMGAAYVARVDWATQHADALRRFVRVLEDAAAYVNKHPAETAALVTELTKVELADAQLLHRTLNGTALDPALVQPIIDAAAKYDMIPRAFPAREIFWT